MHCCEKQHNVKKENLYPINALLNRPINKLKITKHTKHILL
jgi:hypothetical protein